MLSNSRIIPTVPAADIDRARAWYEEKLGLKPSQERPDGLMYDCGEGSQFLLYPTSFAGTAQNTLVAWRVGDIQAEMSDLRGRGVVFEEYDFPGLKTVDGVADVEGLKGSWFKDSEGNTLALAQEP
jgi:catechol 2,3-dioxygenase-like lactoylglutathione lyase family enzyme